MHIARSVAVAGFCGFLVACGGGGGGGGTTPPPPPAESSGVLQAGKLKGVSWRTATRSGTTDAAGTFKYLPGETITFSIGGIELGSTSGATQVSLFTLAGATPPDTELALRREIERGRYASTPFTRAVNLSILVLSLDADGDPSNGVDVAAGNISLAGKQLAMSGSVNGFTDRLSRLAPGLNYNIPRTRSIGFLFSSLGLQIRAGAIVRQGFTTTGADNATDIVTTYDANGEVATVTATQQPSLGSGPSVTTVTHDAMGRILQQHTDYFALAGPPPNFTHTSVNTYDTHGNVVSNVETDLMGATVVGMSTNHATFDAFGRMLVNDYTFGIPNALASGVRGEYTWDERGNLTHQLITVDYQKDGDPETTYETTLTFDAGDRPLTATYLQDNTGDGVPDSIEVDTYTFDGAGAPVTLVTTRDLGGDGSIDERVTTRYTRDARGAPSRTVEETETTPGVIERRVELLYTFDAEGRQTSLVANTDDGADGSIDIVGTFTWVYDANGFLTSATNVSDDKVSGVVAYLSRGTYTYDANGAKLTSLDEYDTDADGTIDSSDGRTYQYAPVDNGIVQLVNQYYPPAGASGDYVTGGASLP